MSIESKLSLLRMFGVSLVIGKTDSEPPMNAKLHQILDDALELSEEDRVNLADLLLESVDFARDFERQAEWEAEIKRRVEEVENGTAKTIPWEEVRRKLFERIRSHASD